MSLICQGNSKPIRTLIILASFCYVTIDVSCMNQPLCDAFCCAPANDSFLHEKNNEAKMEQIQD